jgi:hypothetical protein
MLVLDYVDHLTPGAASYAALPVYHLLSNCSGVKVRIVSPCMPLISSLSTCERERTACVNI